jgi:hypothetical protein
MTNPTIALLTDVEIAAIYEMDDFAKLPAAKAWALLLAKAV